MIQATVGDLNTNHSKLLNSVIQGEDIEILFGRAKKPVAKVTKIQEKQKRNIGTLDKISSFSEIDNGKITIKKFLEI